MLQKLERFAFSDPINAEKNLNLISSIILNGFRIRLVGNRAYYRPINETFHDFLEFIAIETLGKDWFKKQFMAKENGSHSLFKYFDKYNKRKKDGTLIDVRMDLDGNMSAIPSGQDLFWLLFCYDLFCLSHKKVLSSDLINRLKDSKHFQGARYELAVAAIILRAGCDIKWINKDDCQNKTCEFEAVHKASGIKFVVEAKSKKRYGVLNEPGICSSDIKSFASFLKDALKKEVPQRTLFVIFIDANLPFDDVSHERKTLVTEVKRAVGTLSENKDKFNLLVITSFPFHYGDKNISALPPENCIVLPNNNNDCLPVEIFNDLDISLKTYAKIPEEI